MTTPRLLATDLDGTLVIDHAVSEEDARALARWRQAGNLLVLATGRSASLVGHAVEVAASTTRAGLAHDYIVCASGTTVLDAGGAVIATHPLAPGAVRAATALLSRRDDTAVFASTLEGDCCLHKPLPLLDDQRLSARYFPPRGLEELLAGGAAVTSMPCYVTTEEAADALAAELEAAVPGVSAVRSPHFIDVVPAGQDKGAGLRHLLAHLRARGTRVRDVAAVGDSWNDLPMMAVADVSCAVASGKEAVLGAADLVLPSVAALVGHLLDGEGAQGAVGGPAGGAARR